MPETVMSAAAFSIQPDWSIAVQECGRSIAEQRNDGDSGVGFVYLSGSHCANASHIVAGLERSTGISSWIGTSGYAICASGREFHDGSAISVMVVDVEPDQYRVVRGFGSDVAQALDTHRDWIKQNEARFAVVHADPRNPGVQQLVTDFSRELDHGFLVGGLSSSEGDMVQVAGTTAEGVMSGILFASSVNVATGVSQGCKPVSSRRLITMAEDNAIHELDDRPALEVLQEILGDPPLEELPARAAELLVALPVQGADTGDYLVRNIHGIDVGSNSVWIADTVTEGSTLMFCRRDKDAAREDLIEMVKKVRDRAGTPAGALYHTCLARGPHLFGRPNAELEIIQSELGDIPLTGFFSNGEICHNRLYAYTGVLTLF